MISPDSIPEEAEPYFYGVWEEEDEEEEEDGNE
jgi:hypothetical protein